MTSSRGTLLSFWRRWGIRMSLLNYMIDGEYRFELQRNY